MSLEVAPSPLVDLLPIDVDITETDLRVVGEQIVNGFQRNGYVYLKNHGLTLDDIRLFIGATDTFFDLNDNIKNKYKRSIHTFHGYSTEKHEAVDQTIPLQSKALRNGFGACNFVEPFPDEEVPEIRQTATNIMEKILPISFRILHCLELGLKMKTGTLVKSHQSMMKLGNLTGLKSIRYMPPEEDEQINRLEAHLDISTITLQLHGDLEGLELMDNDGKWQKSKLFPGYILLFPSEIIQRWTGDQVKASMHRVMIPEDEATRKRMRHAVIFFILPDNHEVIKPFDGSNKYIPVTVHDFVHNKSKVTFKALFDEQNICS